MKDAFTRGGKRVDAADARGDREYFCCDCGKQVYRVATGGTQLPHFRHVPNEASRSCPHYVLGGTGSSAPRSTAAVEDAANEPGLGIELLPDGGWSLFVRVPEVPLREMSGTTLPALASARVRLRAGGNEVGRISALDLRPGVGIGRASVPPSSAVYQLTPEGTWPPSIALPRWRAFARGLDRKGSVFRLRRGEWLRIRESSTVEWGEQLVLVAESTAPSPQSCGARVLGEASYAAVTWTARQISLPRTADPDVGDWFARLRVEVKERAWSVSLSTVPAEFDETGVPAYPTSETIVCSLSSPFGDTTTFAYVRRDTEQLATPVTADAASRCYVKCSSLDVGRYSLAVGDALAAKQVFTVRRPLEAEELRVAISAAPRLVVKCGDVTLEGWGARAQIGDDLDPATVEVTTTHGELDATIAVGWSDGHHERHVLDETLAEATRSLRRIISGTTAWVRLDAGALGSVVVTVASARILDPAAERRTSRLAGYISNRLAIGARGDNPAHRRPLEVLGARVASLASFRDPAAYNLMRVAGRGTR